MFWWCPGLPHPKGSSFRAPQTSSLSTINGLGRESILRSRTSIRDGIQIVVHSLTIQFTEVKVVLNGRGLSRRRTHDNR
jgi:hypothetical protein